MTMQRRIEIVIILLAALIAIAYYINYRGLPTFAQLSVDEVYQDQSARAIASGALTSQEPFFRAPLYSYWLGLIYALDGKSAATARLVQLLIGALIPLLVSLIARRLFDSNLAALLAAALALLCADTYYFEGELLLESLLTPIILLGFWLWLRYQERPSHGAALLLGLISGIAVITRPNAVVFALVWLYFIWRSRSVERSIRNQSVVRFLLLLCLPVALVLLHNLTREEPAFSIATQGGINFYLGNNHSADGVSAVMPGRLGYAWQYEDVKHAAETDEGRSLTVSQVSGYYYGKALSEIVSDPVAWLKLLVRKTYLFFSAAPLSNNRDLKVFQDQSQVLRLLPVGMWLLAPLGLLGIVVAWRKNRQARALSVAVLLYAATFILFFVNSRFRAPLLPLLAILGGGYCFWLVEQLKEKRVHLAAFGVTVAALLLIFLSSNLYNLKFSNKGQDHFTRGNFLLRQGDNQGAISEYREALAATPGLPQARLNLGVAFMRSGRPDSAAEYFAAEDALVGGSAEALNNLAYLARESGKPELALRFARKAYALKPYLEDASLNYWNALRESGRSDSAFISIRAWSRDHKLTVQQQLVLGAVALDIGRADTAVTVLRKLLSPSGQQTQPGYAELSQPPRLLGSLDSTETARLVAYDLGTAFGHLGELDSAIAYLQRTLEIDPDFSEGWINLASAYMVKRNLPAAHQALERAVALGRYLRTVYYNLARLSLAEADTARARRYVKQSLAQDSVFAPALELQSQLK